MKIGIAGNGKIVHEMIGATKNIQDLEIVAICSRPQSRQKAEEIADKFNIAKIYTNIALAQRDEFKVEAALKSYNACINILESNYLDCQTKYSDQLVMAYFNLGVAQEYFGFTSEAIATYSLAIDSSKNMQIKAGVELTQESKETLASIYFNIAEIRYNSFDLEAAISGYQLTLKLNEDHQKNGQSQFKNKLAYIYFNLGNAQGSLGYTDESIASYLSAIDLWMECFSPAIDDSNKINSNIANAFSNLAIIQKKSGDLKSAIIAYQKAIVFFERMTEYPDFSSVSRRSSEIERLIPFSSSPPTPIIPGSLPPCPASTRISGLAAFCVPRSV